MQINDKALEAAAEAFYDAGENENWTWETETQENKEYVLKATKAAIEAYEKAKLELPFTITAYDIEKKCQVPFITINSEESQPPEQIDG